MPCHARARLTHPPARRPSLRRQQDQLLAFFLEREKLLTAFQQVDTDHSGKIDKEEMGTLLESLGE